MSESRTHAFNWRQRGATLAASTMLVAAICVVLFVMSRHSVLEESSQSSGVEVLLQLKPPVHPHAPPSAPAAASRLPSPLAPAQSGDPVLSQMLVCFGPHRAQHPECARVTATPDAPQLAIGSHSDRDVMPDRRGLYSRGEELGDLTPPVRCAPDRSGTMVGVCRSLYPDPPPPSRTAEEICAAQNMGGPCHPPIPDEPQHVRRTPSTPP